MQIGRTAAPRGQHVYWYIYADLPDEQAAMKAGLLEEKAPDARWRYVLAWGFRSRQAAQDAMSELEPTVAAAVEMLHTPPIR